MQFKFKDGCKTHSGLTADVVGSELERIREENSGQLRPPDVVAAAKPKDSLLHGEIYKHGDREAAHQHRLWLARHLVKSVTVIYKDNGPELPRYVSVQNGGQYYQSTEVIVRRSNEFEAALGLAKGKLAGAHRSLSDLLEIGRQSKSKGVKQIALALDSVSVAKDRVEGIQ